ncbi:MAG: cyclomaltodextrinase C-terminal domain-containing protein, partial [Chitinophagales bacterium]
AVFFMTTRGIPQWYYGDEILFEGFGNPLDALRPDFPGGWDGDKVNKFNPDNLKGNEKEYYQFIATLANWRKNNEVFKSGKLMQFIPEEGMYVYFRYTDNASVMIVLNTNMQATELDTKRFSERMEPYSKGKNVITGETYNSLQKLNVPQQSALVIELLK